MGDEEFEELLEAWDTAPSKDYVRISPGSLSLMQMRFAAGEISQTSETPELWIQVLRNLHLSLVAALTEAMSGTHSAGALRERPRKKAMEKLAKRETDIPDGPVMALRELVKAAKNGFDTPTDGRLELSEVEDLMIERLNFLREAIDHPKATLHSIAVPAFAEVAEIVAPLVLRVCRAVPHRYEIEELQLAEIHSQTIEAFAAKTLARYALPEDGADGGN